LNSKRFKACRRFSPDLGSNTNATANPSAVAFGTGLHLPAEPLRLHVPTSGYEWLVPGRSPFGFYLYTEDVDALAAEFVSELTGKKGPEDKPWGTSEFALSDPDQALARVGPRLQRRPWSLPFSLTFSPRGSRIWAK
jgi:hypothetical protein